MKLFIAESPNKAGLFGKALGVTGRGDGYLENGSIRISWAVGHLVGLAEPDVYDPELAKWSRETLPILPDPFKLSIGNGMSKQFNVLKNLMADATEIICATDSDREGDLIFHYIHTLSGSRKQYKRILPNDLTVNGIKKIVSREIEPRIEVINSALCRSRLDWLIGMNATRAISISAGRKITMGRVQTPTLALICKRFLDNKNFVSTPYYPVTIELEKSGIKFRAKLKETPTDINEAKEIVSSLESTSTCIYAENKQETEKQPIPYELGSLQIDAAKKFDFSAKQTLEIAQSLYEKHKLITYPRTDSGYLTEDLFLDVPDRIKNLLGIYDNPIFEGLYDLTNLPKRCVSDKKAPNHQGIIPTDELENYKKLDTREKELFDLISLRFLAAFAPVCLKDKTKYEFSNASKTYVTNGSVIIQNGWRVVFEEPDKEQSEDGEIEDLPKVLEQEELATEKGEFSSKMTKAPALLTQDSLVKLMMSCGKDLDDEELRRAMRENELRTGGLGTSATRGDIIENVFQAGLIMKEKRKIIPTEIGLSLYEKIKDLDISKPELTAKLQLKLDHIASGDFDHNIFMKEITEYTKSVTSDMLEAGLTIDTDELKLTCPKCKKGKIIEGKKGFGCNRYKEENPCDFVIWKSKGGKMLSISHAKALIERGVTPVIKGFQKYDPDTERLDPESKFDVPLKLNNEKWTVEYSFNEPAKNKTGEELQCPKCQKSIRLNKGGAFCSDSDNCDFKIWRNKSEKILTDSLLIALLTKKKTGKIKGFLTKDKKSFEAALELKDDLTVGFIFNK